MLRKEWFREMSDFSRSVSLRFVRHFYPSPLRYFWAFFFHLVPSRCRCRWLRGRGRGNREREREIEREKNRSTAVNYRLLSCIGSCESPSHPPPFATFLLIKTHRGLVIRGKQKKTINHRHFAIRNVNKRRKRTLDAVQSPPERVFFRRPIRFFSLIFFPFVRRMKVSFAGKPRGNLEGLVGNGSFFSYLETEKSVRRDLRSIRLS